MAWSPLKFTSAPEKAAPVPASASPRMGVTAVALDGPKAALASCDKILRGTEELIDFVDKDRKYARKIGVETIAIELSGIVSGDRLQEVRSVLAAGTQHGNSIPLSPDTMKKLRRAENLLAEATREIAADSSNGTVKGALLGSDGIPGYGWVAVVALGVAAAGVVLYSITKPDKKPMPSMDGTEKLGSFRRSRRMGARR